MKRNQITKRNNWQEICEKEGFSFHTPEGKPYWIEGANYSFTREEIEYIKYATNTLYNMCLNVVNYVVNNPEYLFHLKIPESAHKFVINSWKNKDVELYSRFDLMRDSSGNIKMAEINGQTPQSILEAGRIQKTWAKSFGFKQFNDISENMFVAFKDLKINSLHFTCVPDEVEDRECVKYLQDCSFINNKFIYINDIGWDGSNFLDLENKVIKELFLLYPFEWLTGEEFFNNITFNNFKPINPWWTYILSSKGILPLLWEMYPDSEFLLPSFWNIPESHKNKKIVKKSLYGREGSNISIVENAQIIETSYDNNYTNIFGEIYQEYFEIETFDEYTPIIGSWIVNSESCGIGIREDKNKITTVNGHFVPHIIEGNIS